MNLSPPPDDVRWRGFLVPKEFVYFGMNFHQDIFLISGTTDQAIVDVLGNFDERERTAMKTFLSNVLDGRFSNAELKGLWGVARPQVGFGGAKGVREFLERTLKHLYDLG